MTKQLDFLGYSLSGDTHRTNRDGQLYKVFVYGPSSKNEEEPVFSESTHISGTAICILLGSRTISAAKYLEDQTFAKAKGRIQLGMFISGQEYEQVITSEMINRKELEIDDETVQKMILECLLRIRRHSPANFKTSYMDLNGFCKILSISKDAFIFNASILLEKQLIAVHNGSEILLENANCYITATGLAFISKIQNQHNLGNFQGGTNSLTKEKILYDIAISFAGEDRVVAEEIAEKLKIQGVKVFYDDFEKVDLWGKNLYDHLSFVYGEAARFCLIIISENYARKNWTNLERIAAQAKAFRQKQEYILPLRLDETPIPGIPETVGYVSLKDNSIDKIVRMLILKLESIF
ncbi:MAG: TIR domain-containing protein [Candidatus Ozemobacteraceae bacterium]